MFPWGISPQGEHFGFHPFVLVIKHDNKIMSHIYINPTMHHISTKPHRSIFIYASYINDNTLILIHLQQWQYILHQYSMTRHCSFDINDNMIKQMPPWILPRILLKARMLPKNLEKISILLMLLFLIWIWLFDFTGHVKTMFWKI